MAQKEVIYAGMLIATGLALIAAGFWLPDSSLLIRAVLVVCGLPSVLRGAFLCWKARNTQGS